MPSESPIGRCYLLADLPEGLLDRVVAALRQAEPAAVGVLVTGGYAGGRATSHGRRCTRTSAR
jgi:hypothetical protein